MTEAEWLACTDPLPMLDFLRGKVSDRKVRLFVCACCRAVWKSIPLGDFRGAVLTAERYCEVLAGEEDLTTARDATQFALANLPRTHDRQWYELNAPAYAAACAVSTGEDLTGTTARAAARAFARGDRG